jgi:WD40 repeat protein
LSYFKGYRSDSSTGYLIDTIDLPEALALTALSPTGDYLLWSNGRGDIGIFDRTNRTSEIISYGGVFTPSRIAWNPVNNIVGWTVGSRISFYDTANHQDAGYLSSATAPRIATFAWSPDGQKIVTSHYAEDVFSPGTEIRTAQVWDVSTITDMTTTPLFTIEDRGGNSVTWSPDGTQFAVVEHGGFFVYDMLTDQMTTIEYLDEAGLASIQWSPDGSQIATGGTDIHIWDTTTWEHIRDIPGKLAQVAYSGRMQDIIYSMKVVEMDFI